MTLHLSRAPDINCINSGHIYYRRYNVRSILEDFLNNDMNRQLKMIEDIHQINIQYDTNFATFIIMR